MMTICSVVHRETGSGTTLRYVQIVRRCVLIDLIVVVLQAMDIAGLSKLTAETLVLVVSVLGFMVRVPAVSLLWHMSHKYIY